MKHYIPGLRRKRVMPGDGVGISQYTLAETIERNLAQFLEFLPVAFEDRHEVLLGEVEMVRRHIREKRPADSNPD